MLVGLLVGVGLAGGCAASTPSAGTQLTIETQTGDVSTVLVPSQATLRCDGTAAATGFLQKVPAPACAAVRQNVVQKIAASQRTRRVCSQVYGGPQTAHITGTVDRRHVDLTVTRTDGCGIADWQTLEPLLGDPQRQGNIGPKAPTRAAATTTVPRQVSYVTKPGDTLTAIAKRFGVPIAALVSANHLTDPDHLAEGVTLVIPAVPPAQLVITSSPAQSGTVLDITLTGAQPAEAVTFEIDTPSGTYTGPAHPASAEGVVTATYESNGAPGTYTVIATGTDGTAARQSFVIDPAG